MPRTYVRKKEPPSYSLEDVRRAVEDVTELKKTYREAREYYGVPTAVIFHRIKGRKVPLDKMGGGASKALPERVEHHLVNCLKARAKMGHPCHKEELKLLVGEYVMKLKIKTPFKNNVPGDCWYQNFMKRHPSLSLKKPELLQKARTDARRPHVVYDFYDMLLTEVTNNNLADKPRYIFNADESGFHHDPSKLRAIGEKGMALSRVTGGSGRESTSVLACVSADGKFLPPCIVFKGTAVQARWVSDKAYPGTLYGATKNGWMEEPTFHNWLVNGFIPYIDKIRKDNNEPDHKVILIYDGHSSHISVRIVEDAIKANIILVKFPSHMTDRIQPLDKCVFGPVKTYWDKTLVEHGVKQMGKGSAHLSKEKFTELLGEVWGQALTPKNIVSGFSTTGVFPVDASKFPKKLFNASELKTYQNLVNTVNDIVTGESSDELVNDLSIHSNSTFTDIIQQPQLNDGSISPHCSNSEKPVRVPVSETIDDVVGSPYSSVESHSDSTSARKNTDGHVTPDCSNSEKPVSRVPVSVIIDDVVGSPYSSVGSHSDSASARINTDEHVTLDCSNSEKPVSRVPVSVIMDDVPYYGIESRLYSDSDSALNTDDNVTPDCSNTEEFNRRVLVKSIDEHVSPHCSRIENRYDSVPTKANDDELASPHCSFKKNTNIDYRGSSVLLNNILKLITLDTSANDSVKAKLLKALSSADCVEDSSDDFMSPNKDILDKLFKTQKSPEKGKKIVIPRLKVATYGEVLTSDAVKDRLKKAEEEKTTKKTKIKIKVEKGLKNKGQGKRTKCANLHQENEKEDKKENNRAKKTRLDKIDMETDEIMVEKANKDQCKQVNFLQKKDTGDNKQKKVRVHVSDSESEGEQDVPYADSDSDYNIECETEECDWLETMGTENLITGNFVLVQFKGGKRLATVYRYLCMVDSIDEDDDNEIVVTSLKSVDSSKQVFALNDKDTSCVPITDIIGLLPEPLISLKGERIFYKFQKPIDVFEKA